MGLLYHFQVNFQQIIGVLDTAWAASSVLSIGTAGRWAPIAASLICRQYGIYDHFAVQINPWIKGSEMRPAEKGHCRLAVEQLYPRPYSFVADPNLKLDQNVPVRGEP